MSALPQFWHDWRRKHRAALIGLGMVPALARVLAEIEAQARAGVERHAGRAAALAADFVPDPDRAGAGTLWIDSHLVPPERRAAAKAALGLPPDY